MTKDNQVLQFPGKTNMEPTIDPAIEAKVKAALAPKNLPDTCSETNTYFLTNVLMSNQALNTVEDKTYEGDQRTHKWGAVVSLGIIPGVDQNPVGGPVIIPQSPSQFFDADSLDELRERIIFELDQSLAAARVASEYPEEYQMVQTALTLNRMEMSPDQVGTESEDVWLD